MKRGARNPASAAKPTRARAAAAAAAAPKPLAEALVPKDGDGLAIQWVPIERVTPYARNPRRNARSIPKVKASLKEFGWRQPIVVDPEFVIVVGHTRYLAARELAMARVPVHVAHDLTPTQVRAYRLADNRTGDDSTWDDELLSLELVDLEADGFDLSVTAFDDADLAVYLRRPLAAEGESGSGEPASLDPDAEWNAAGMPEFAQPNARAYQEIKVHLADEAAVRAFAKMIGQEIHPRTRFVWIPARAREVWKDQEYAPEP